LNIATGRDVPRGLAHECLRDDCRGGRSIASALEDSPHQMADDHRAHVFERIGQLEGAPGDGRRVVQDLGRSTAHQAADGDGPRCWPECRAEQAGHRIHTPQQSDPRGGVAQDA
jgi:hypothetical protein